MTDANQMTPKELRELADKKEQDAINTPIKHAELKHDLYTIDVGKVYPENCWFITEKAKNNLLDKMISLVLPKGTKFECYNCDGEELWFDDDGYIEEAEGDWAEEHLINIRTIDEE